MTEEIKEKRKLTDAKVMSKIFKVVAVAGIIVCHILKWNKKLYAESSDICFMWAVVYGVGAGTIDLNIIIDKFRR